LSIDAPLSDKCCFNLIKTVIETKGIIILVEKQISIALEECFYLRKFVGLRIEKKYP